MRLPRCEVQHPACGACWSETDFDGDIFACYLCGLNYGDGEDNTEAEFLEDVTACGVECSNGWHKTLGLACEPCKLPKGHESMCWTDCKDQVKA